MSVPAAFRPGERVRVMEARALGHVRTPTYVMGHEGEIALLVGAFGNPEDLAYGRDKAPAVPLYRVRFRQRDLWANYRGASADTIDVEIYQHWLEPA